MRIGEARTTGAPRPDFVTGYQRPSEPSTYGIRLSCIRNATNSFARRLFFAASNTTPVFTAARYVIGEPSGLGGEAAVTISSS